MTVPARCEDDIDADEIIKKVAKSSGANYSVHNEKGTKEFVPDPAVCINFL